MAYPHLFIPDRGEKIDYAPISRAMPGTTYPIRNRQAHGNRLRLQFQRVQQELEQNQQNRTALALSIKQGVYLRLSGQAGSIMSTKSLDLRSQEIRLLQQYEELDVNNQKINVVIIYVPEGKITIFLQKIAQYLEENTSGGNPRNNELLVGIEAVRLATLEHFWKGRNDILSSNQNIVWCEFWLRTLPEQEDEIINTFRASCISVNIGLRANQQIKFPERLVLLGKASIQQLVELLEISPHIAEIRPATIPVNFLLEVPPAEQAEFAQELAERFVYNNDSDIGILILDTGVNNQHILLQDSLSDSDLHSYEEDWGVNDHDKHGTGMAGLALLGDLQPLLSSNNQIEITHCLESGKIRPKEGDTPYHLYGDVIKQVIYRAEIQEPNRRRIYCMASTSEEYFSLGKPTSWSGAIDNLCSGAEDNKRRLFFTSAGNIRDTNEWLNYPDSNQTQSVQDPAQAWNAITVGAFTKKVIIDQQQFQNYQPIAEAGNLSPCSTTSLLWDNKKWPIKPDIVMEGGNMARDINYENYATTCDDLFPLSTWYRPIERQFEPFGETSGATALAARMAAQIQNVYPDIWPETVRALLIHSAEWTPIMLETFLADNRKESYKNLVRTCGFGVPDLNRATTCIKNRLNLVIESTIQPFRKNSNGSYSNNEMEVFELPWPRDQLLQLGELEVELRVTLSYFIEPGPGEIGWKDRYRYASHGLRFDISRENESREFFLARINRRNRNRLENYQNDAPNSNWLLGNNNRQLGSIHSDIWRGTAAQMAECNLVGVYPVIGWWKERHYLKKFNKKTRYSLVVSLKTSATEVDIYTPVAVQVGIPVEITT